MIETQKIGTQCIWAGEESYLLQGATQVPVVHSVSFGYRDLDEWLAVALGEKAGHIYGRNTNPTVHAFEEKVRQLEGAEAATSAATGMGIISSALFALLSPGQRVVSVKDTYGGTNVIFTEFLPRFQVNVTLCDTTDHEQIEAEIAKGCDVVYLESPTNPTTKVVDLARLDSNEDIDSAANRLLRLLRNTTFRPRLAAGQPVGTDKLVRAYEIKP